MYFIYFFCGVKLNIQHHYSSLQCHMVLRNHCNMLIWCSRTISHYCQCLVMLVNMFVETFNHIFFWNSFIYTKLKRTAFIWNINLLYNVNVMFMNKSIIFLTKKILLTPNKYYTILYYIFNLYLRMYMNVCLYVIVFCVCMDVVSHHCVSHHMGNWPQHRLHANWLIGQMEYP